MMAVVHLAIDDDAGADPGSDGHECARVVPARRATPVLADDGKVDVVFDNDRRSERAPEDHRHRHLRPAGEVRREGDDDAARAIDHARRAGRDGKQPADGHARFGHQRLHLGGHFRQQLLGRTIVR